MNNSIDKTPSCHFSAMDNYEDYGDDEDIDLWDMGMMIIKNFVGEIKYSGHILETGNGKDFDYWNKILWNDDILNNSQLTIPVKSDRIEQVPNSIFRKMVDKWWSQ